jgi:hypothetical protein
MNHTPGPQPFNQIAPTFDEQLALALRPREEERPVTWPLIEAAIAAERADVAEAISVLALRLSAVEAGVRR